MNSPPLPAAHPIHQPVIHMCLGQLPIRHIRQRSLQFLPQLFTLFKLYAQIPQCPWSLPFRHFYLPPSCPDIHIKAGELQVAFQPKQDGSNVCVSYEHCKLIIDFEDVRVLGLHRFHEDLLDAALRGSGSWPTAGGGKKRVIFSRSLQFQGYDFTLRPDKMFKSLTFQCPATTPLLTLSFLRRPMFLHCCLNGPWYPFSIFLRNTYHIPLYSFSLM